MLGPWREADWATALAQLPQAGTRAHAGLIYMQVNLWSPWTKLLAHAAHANQAGVTVYFVGPKLPFELVEVCPSCGWLPLDEARIHKLLSRLGLRLHAQRRVGPRKLCDLKPLWPAMLPEISARHEWIGYADSDIIFGDLAAEVAHLQPKDELLTPAAFYPQPLSNGNFLLMRSVPKMLNAYNRSPDLHKMLAAFRYQGFDEWGLAKRGSMMRVYQDMLFAGELVARPTMRLLVQDAIIINGASFPMVDSFGANVSFEWTQGKLVAQRDGVCVCPDDVIPQFGLTVCDECLAKRGSIRAGIMLHRRVEILGFHFQEWKKRWRKREIIRLTHAAANGQLEYSRVPLASPSCSSERVASTGFYLVPRGFRCGQPMQQHVSQPPLQTESRHQHRFPPDWQMGVECATMMAPQLWGCAKGKGRGKIGARRVDDAML